MGCEGCGKNKQRLDMEFKNEIAKNIQKALFDFTSNEYDVLVLGCGSMIIFYRTEIGESEMQLKLKPENGYIKAEGNVLHPTKEIFEFKMTLTTPEKESMPINEKYIRHIEGKYIDKEGNVFELNN